jgi:hypothetical protein
MQRGIKEDGTMTPQYRTPTVPAEWSDSRETHPAVAMAIHAIADSARSPESIWFAPTVAEIGHVEMAVENYIACGLFEAEPDGWYPWGAGGIDLAGDVEERR